MLTMKTLEQKLQKATLKQSKLYLFCHFITLMMITAMSALLFSPTVLNVLPVGGDSRKQMYLIYGMILIGSVVFILYVTRLFFRQKSKQLGILMALGASSKRLAPGLFKEVFYLNFVSSLFGTLAAFPFVWLLWGVLRLFAKNNSEMILIFDFKCLGVSLLFFLLVMICSCITAFGYLKKINIMDIIQEVHKNEPVPQLGTWCGPLGIILVLLGGILGYISNGLYMDLFSAFPPAWINLLYIPCLIGLYLIILHTITHGWSSHKKYPYKNIISRSMMKFQGKQTVNQILVATLLTASGCFGLFYTPIALSAAITEIQNRHYDYSFHYRADQSMPAKAEIEMMAQDDGLSLTDWQSGSYSALAMDGNAVIEPGDGSFYYDYRDLLCEGTFISETTFNTISRQNIEIPSGTYYGIANTEETSTFILNLETTKLTNPLTKQVLPVQFGGFVHFNDLFSTTTTFYVLEDQDYAQISKGLTKEWQGNMLFFNEEGTSRYAFGKKLYDTLIQSFTTDCLTASRESDRIANLVTQANSSGDSNTTLEEACEIDPYTSDFNLYWSYMPKFRALDQGNVISTHAVFLSLFVLIAITCLTITLIMCFIRCQTLVLNNRYVFDDLKRLGASSSFLTKEVKNQCRKVFQIPALVGMSAMYLLFSMLMYGNDGFISSSELIGLAISLMLLLLLGLLFYLLYGQTVKIVKKQLEIE